MGRPKGSRNKIKPSLSMAGEMYISEEDAPWQVQKESESVDVSTAVKRPSRGLKKKIDTTTTTPTEKETSSCGESSVVPATTRVIKGFVNIQRNPHSRKESYYTGGDIHPTEEDAKKYATRNTVDTIFVSFEIK